MSIAPGVLADLVRRAHDGAPRLGASGRGGPADRGEGAPSGTRVVVIDGPAGSGKTTLAGGLGAALRAPVIHMDDLYEGWGGLEDSWERLARWVLDPLDDGRPGRYRRYDWERGEFAEAHDVPLGPYLVVEGCGSGRLEADEVATLRIWVEADDEVRLARGLDRDGESAREEWRRWMVAEREHYARNRTRERADVRLDGFGRLVGTRVGDPA